jgi:hypothetical protein
MFGEKAKEIRILRDIRDEQSKVIAVLRRNNSELKATRIRVSVATDLGVKPVFDVEMEYAIMLNNVAGGEGRKFGEWILEIISQYRPVFEADDSDTEWMQDA